MAALRLLRVIAAACMLASVFGQETETSAIDCACVNGVCSRSSQGTVSCLCDKYWGGDLCDQRIDWCAQNPCQDENAECQTSGAISWCSCQHGFEQGPGGECVRSLMWPDFKDGSTGFGTSDNNNLYGLWRISEYPFPFFNFSTIYFYITNHGYIRMGNFESRSFWDIDPLMKTSWTAYPFYLAPYWSDMSYDLGRTDSHVYISEGFRHDNLNTTSSLLDYVNLVMKRDSPDFSALGAYAVTWSQGHPAQTTRKGTEAATVQLIVATDYQFTYAIFTWKSLFSDSQYAGGPQVVSGYSGPEGGFVPLEPMMGTQKIIPLFSSGTPTSAPKECVEKQREAFSNTDFDNWVRFACHCAENDAKLDFRLMNVAARSTAEKQRYQALYFSGGMKQECCYDRNGLILTEYPDAAVRVHEPPAQEPTWQTALDFCCTVSPMWCHWAPRWQGSCVSTPTTIVAAAGGYGSIRVRRFKGNSFTFNGWGEFTLVKYSPDDNIDIEIQGRTQRRAEESTTYLSAFALRPAINTTSYQIYVTSEGNLQHGWTQGTAMDPGQFLVDGSQPDTVIITTLRFRLRVTKSDGGSLDLMLTMAEDAWSQGLLGNVGANSDNDFEEWRVTKETSLFDYTKPSASSYEAQNEHPGFTPRDLSHDAEDILSSMDSSTRSLANDTCGTDLYCLQVFSVYGGDVSEASKALAWSKQVEDAVTALNVAGPQFEGLSSYKFSPSNITAGFSVEITMKSPTVGQLDFSVDGSLADVMRVSVESNTLTFPAANLAALRAVSYPQKLTILAKDRVTGLTSRYTPRLFFCLCEQDGQCDKFEFDFVHKEGDPNGNAIQVTCACDFRSESWPHLGGRLCEKTVDACTDCYNQTACDPAKRYSQLCGNSCPAPLEGNGVLCRAPNYCATNNGGCDQICENMEDGPTCSCESGYLVNGSKCIDINECSDDPEICSNSSQYCHNIPGSSECRCYGNGLGPNCVVAPYLYTGSVQLSAASGQRWSPGLVYHFKTSSLRNRVAQSLKSQLTEGTNKLGNPDDILVEVTGFSQISARSRRAVDREPEVEAMFVIRSTSQLSEADLTSAFDLSGCEMNCDMAGTTVYSAPVVQSNADLCSLESVNTCDEQTTMCMQTSTDLAMCKCLPGFEQTSDPNICKDINECEMETEKCPYSSCVNTFGSYSCDCMAGYDWDSVSETCVADVCQSNPCEEEWFCYIAPGTQDGYACSPQSHHLRKDDDSDGYRTALIVVSVFLGIICLAFIISVVVLLRRRQKISEPQSTMHGMDSEKTWAGKIPPLDLKNDIKYRL